MDPTVGREGHVIVIHEVKLLDIIMDNALLLDIHIKVVFEKASQKLSALSRLANYLEPEERKLIFNFMIKS